MINEILDFCYRMRHDYGDKRYYIPSQVIVGIELTDEAYGPFIERLRLSGLECEWDNESAVLLTEFGNAGSVKVWRQPKPKPL